MSAGSFVCGEPTEVRNRPTYNIPPSMIVPATCTVSPLGIHCPDAPLGRLSSPLAGSVGRFRGHEESLLGALEVSGAALIVVDRGYGLASSLIPPEVGADVWPNAFA